ncbi:MADS box transcription factor [Lithospermum erythrorhizon]|uniref:MADS box transcription factor n=1 Tax=Lithospermum erythrorhizon TaxID=34254 RepID=A0AAV3RD54_LITER
MARKKITLAYINNDSQRKATFKKRRKGLMKKVRELSTLCGIDACAIIYSPYETQPDVWPNTSDVQRVVAQFIRMPEMEQSKKMVNQEGFIRQRIAKVTEQLKKQHMDNREKDMTDLMYQCLTGRALQNLMMPDLNDLGWLVDQKLKEISKRIDFLKKGTPQHETVVQDHSAVSTTGIPSKNVNVQEQKLPMDSAIDGLQRPQWFTDWINESSEQMKFGRGNEVMMPFNNNQNTSWPGHFFP